MVARVLFITQMSKVTCHVLGGEGGLFIPCPPSEKSPFPSRLDYPPVHLLVSNLGPYLAASSCQVICSDLCGCVPPSRGSHWHTRGPICDQAANGQPASLVTVTSALVGKTCKEIMVQHLLSPLPLCSSFGVHLRGSPSPVSKESFVSLPVLWHPGEILPGSQIRGHFKCCFDNALNITMVGFISFFLSYCIIPEFLKPS